MVFRCNQCHTYKNEEQFPLSRKKQRSKTCHLCHEVCQAFKDRLLEESPNVVLDESWQPHPQFKHIYCSKAGLFYNQNTQRLIGSIMNNGYVTVSINRTVMLGHHLIYQTFVGPIPDGLVIDHINHIRSDNQLENLRAITYSENINRNLIPRVPKPVIGINQTTGEETAFASMNKAARHLHCFPNSVKICCDGIYNQITSPRDNSKWVFRYA